MILLMSWEVPLMVMEVLGVTHPQALPTQVKDVDENLNFGIRMVESSLGFSAACDSFCHRAVKCFECHGVSG